MIEAAKRHGLGVAQLLSLVLIGAGLWFMSREPFPKDPAMLSAHLFHYKANLGLIGLGLLFFNPNRLVKGLKGVAEAWKAKS